MPDKPPAVGSMLLWLFVELIALWGFVVLKLVFESFADTLQTPRGCMPRFHRELVVFKTCQSFLQLHDKMFTKS